LYLYVLIFMYICVYLWKLHVQMYIFMYLPCEGCGALPKVNRCMYMYMLCAYICMCDYNCMLIYVCMCVSVYVYLKCLCMCLFMYLYTLIYIHLYTHTNTYIYLPGETCGAFPEVDVPEESVQQEGPVHAWV
jgi:hypothetical protein